MSRALAIRVSFVQAPLEAMKRALDYHLVENRGFLHDFADLAIYFITDKDDYSVQLHQRNQLTPAAMDCGTTNPNPGAGCYGLAQLRLSAFKRRLDPAIWTEQSICDPANYTGLFNKWRVFGSARGVDSRCSVVSAGVSFRMRQPREIVRGYCVSWDS
jgi:hypothetical protein